jgi:hypothetical protein|tara:strand:+ start:324 stop:629 length:306 start_codon:yes stop_codon:yes gene_type:complete
MFEAQEEISFDDNSELSKDRQQVPLEVQEGINAIVNKEQASLIKNETQEMIKGGVLGAVIGAILCLYRKKSVWLGVLAGGLVGGYLTKEGIVKISKEKENN